MTKTELEAMYIEKDGMIFTPRYTFTAYELKTEEYTNLVIIKTAEEVYQEWLSNKDKQIDILEIKRKKIQESKELLAAWLADNPMLSEIHNHDGEYYTVTQEKQAQLTQLLMLYSISVAGGAELQLTWNSTGGVCEDWTYEELSTLSFQIAGYVLPRVKMQQEYEVQINACATAEEVEAIEIEYEIID